MRIESGTTSEDFIKSLLFLVLVLVFAAWFGYDGFYGYPAKNLKWAKQHMEPKPEDLSYNRAVNKQNLLAVFQEMEVRNGVPEERREEEGTYWFFGPELKIEDGPPISSVTDVLGEPAMEHEGVYWFVGPAMYAKFETYRDNVEQIQFAESSEKSESSLMGQKIFGLLCLGIGIIFAIKLALTAGRKTVLDDSGLRIRGKHIPWEQMKELDTTDYQRKGWLDLIYEANGQAKPVRLDSYRIARFKEIINEICERKGFENPIQSAPDDTQTTQAEDEQPVGNEEDR